MIRMGICTCRCGCKNRFEEISDQSLALLIALSGKKIPEDKTICDRCRFEKHRQHRVRVKPIKVS